MPIKMSKIEGSLRLVLAYYEDFNRHDAAAMARHLNDDVVLETAAPAPGGRTINGRDAVQAYWQDTFAASPLAHLDIEEIFGFGFHVVARWQLSHPDAAEDADPRHGADIFRVQSGLIYEQYSYLKGSDPDDF